ncbi:Crp/Fnr family transcriptional regulator [Desulfosarcina sp. OttesenSCG-928-A07]|nr:Crp/Fnr family transcriptional regulator [Desulfosarcina sp. OttesenSCG-928-A07]
MKTFEPSIDRVTSLFDRSPLMQRISPPALKTLASLAVIRQYEKNEILYYAENPCNNFVLVETGMIRVSRYSALGKRLTHLLASSGEAINLVSVFTGKTKENVCEAATDSTVVAIDRKAFLAFAFENTQLVINIVDTLGQAIDGSNQRILEMQEKKVVDRLIRVLHGLSEKFGPHLHFTAMELADLASTTTESALRILGDMRQRGIIEKGRGQIHILKPEALMPPEIDGF